MVPTDEGMLVVRSTSMKKKGRHTKRNYGARSNVRPWKTQMLWVKMKFKTTIHAGALDTQQRSSLEQCMPLKPVERGYKICCPRRLANMLPGSVRGLRAEILATTP